MALTPCGSRADQQGRELVQHGTALFPVACYHNDLTRDTVPWHREAIQAMEDAWQSCAQEPPGFDLQVRGALSRLAFLLAGHRPEAVRPPSRRTLREEERVKQMLRFIQEHYAWEIRTADIARSAMVSESECLRCFRAAIGTPPIQFLKQFRIQKAAELLVSTDQTAAEIGALCGFPDASYFTRTFRELKGCTPSAYRKRP